MVKITLKTVQNKLFTVEAEEAETVGDVKRKIEESQTFPVEQQKIIYSGKILQDDTSIGSLKIKEKDFLVVMVSKVCSFHSVSHLKLTSKPKAAPKPVATPTPTEPPAPVASASEVTPAAPAASPIAGSDTTAAAPAAETATSATGLSSSSFVTGPALQAAISSMVEMGFEHDQVVRALRASYNNPDRAVDYLMSGNIPEVEGPAPAATAPPTQTAPTIPTPAAAPSQTPAAPAAQPAPSGSAGSAENLFAAAEAAMARDRGTSAPANVPSLEALGNSPQLQRLRQMVQQNPALIGPLLQQVAAHNPALAQLINQHPEAVYEWLGVGGGEGEDDDDLMGPQTMRIDLTQQEAEAVQRLEQLGFDRQVVLQAYLLCDKNEELAANYLFEQGEEDDLPPQL
ncbi:UV excision repair protein Rad23 [Tremella mesenterica]|uniref:UV excision repair protein RAD23 n=1 Tax=Tremella mesenterica TaxID=5217 RepID=A0A4Q1BRP8_TREME|nr:UV excision repair protein Rad23 [Tremella mesenterica]